jgi:hypothetical protein
MRGEGESKQLPGNGCVVSRSRRRQRTSRVLRRGKGSDDGEWNRRRDPGGKDREGREGE